MTQKAYLVQLRKRFLYEFNRVRFVKGKVMSKGDLALSIGMTASQVTRTGYEVNPTTPTVFQIFLLCQKHGADIEYIFLGVRGK